HPAHRYDTDGAARSVNQLDVGGEEIVDAVLVDRVCVSSAHLHELVVASRLDRSEDLGGEHAPQLRIAELVDKSHRGFAPLRSAVGSRQSAVLGSRRTRATRACTSTESPFATASTSAVSTDSFDPSAASHRARPRSPSTASTVIRTPSSEHVMQWSPWQSSVTRSRSPS